MPENSLCQYQQSAGPWGLHATPEQFPLKGALRAQIPRSLSTLQVTEGSRWARRKKGSQASPSWAELISP